MAAGIGVAIGLAGMLVYFAVALEPDANRAARPAGAAPGWVEIKWTFAVDPWWLSKAFACDRATCGADITLLVRAKLGFCNCATGVADDAELDRIGDFQMISRQHSPIADGRPITVAGLKGRSRSYTMDSAVLVGGSALLIGVNDRCDALVATAAIANPASSTPSSVAEQAVVDFLDSPRVKSWVETALGL